MPLGAQLVKHFSGGRGKGLVVVAYGDLTAVILALIALAALRFELGAAGPAVWIFNIEGTADLLYANVATFTAHVDPAALGVSYYLAVVNVPAMLVAHFVIFRYLLRRPRS
jgi:hypothetical protein